MTMKRDLGNTNPAQAKKNGWVVDHGDPAEWRVICKAHNDAIGLMKTTKRLKVPGGWLYQVTTEGPLGYAEALTFVPGIRLRTGETE